MELVITHKSKCGRKSGTWPPRFYRQNRTCGQSPDTGELTREELEAYLRKLAAGTLTHQEVFADMGHGALMLDARPAPLDFLVVAGPRWSLIRGSTLDPYLAAPYGDMMIAGNYGLLRAFAEHVPETADAINARLHRGLAN